MFGENKDELIVMGHQAQTLEDHQRWRADASVKILLSTMAIVYL